MFPTCPVCNHPVRRRNRVVHKSCADQQPSLGRVGVQRTITENADGTVTITRTGGMHECCFCFSTDTSEKDGGWFCEKHYPYDERTNVQNRTLTVTPERCPGCGEPITPKTTKGRIKCKCEQPKMPRHLRGNDDDDLPPSRVRYGN